MLKRGKSVVSFISTPPFSFSRLRMLAKIKAAQYKANVWVGTHTGEPL